MIKDVIRPLLTKDLSPKQRFNLSNYDHERSKTDFKVRKHVEKSASKSRDRRSVSPGSRIHTTDQSQWSPQIRDFSLFGPSLQQPPLTDRSISAHHTRNYSSPNYTRSVTGSIKIDHSDQDRKYLQYVNNTGTIPSFPSRVDTQESIVETRIKNYNYFEKSKDLNSLTLTSLNNARFESSPSRRSPLRTRSPQRSPRRSPQRIRVETGGLSLRDLSSSNQFTTHTNLKTDTTAADNKYLQYISSTNLTSNTDRINLEKSHQHHHHTDLTRDLTSRHTNLYDFSRRELSQSRRTNLSPTRRNLSPTRRHPSPSRRSPSRSRTNYFSPSKRQLESTASYKIQTIPNLHHTSTNQDDNYLKYVSSTRSKSTIRSPTAYDRIYESSLNNLLLSTQSYIPPSHEIPTISLRRHSPRRSPRRDLKYSSPTRRSPTRLESSRLSPKRLSPSRLSPTRHHHVYPPVTTLSPRRLSPTRHHYHHHVQANSLSPRRLSPTRHHQAISILSPSRLSPSRHHHQHHHQARVSNLSPSRLSPSRHYHPTSSLSPSRMGHSTHHHGGSLSPARLSPSRRSPSRENPLRGSPLGRRSNLVPSKQFRKVHLISGYEGPDADYTDLALSTRSKSNVRNPYGNSRNLQISQRHVDLGHSVRSPSAHVRSYSRVRASPRRSPVRSYASPKSKNFENPYNVQKVEIPENRGKSAKDEAYLKYVSTAREDSFARSTREFQGRGQRQEDLFEPKSKGFKIRLQRIEDGY